LSLPQPDHGVLRKAQRGDERAFSIIVRAYQIPVYNYVLRMVGDRSLAEDLTQEVFLRVFQGLPRFSHGSKFTTWLFQVTKNRVLDELRATERRPRAVVDLDDIPPLEVVDAPFERLEAIDAVWRAVERLNVDLKMALLLRDVVGHCLHIGNGEHARKRRHMTRACFNGRQHVAMIVLGLKVGPGNRDACAHTLSFVTMTHRTTLMKDLLAARRRIGGRMLCEQRWSDERSNARAHSKSSPHPGKHAI